MTLSEIQEIVRFRTGRHDLLTGTSLTVLNYSINEAQRELVRRFRFTETEKSDTSQSTIADQAFIARLSSWYAIYTVYDTTNDVPIRPFPGGWDRYEKTQSQALSSAERMTHYILFENRLYFRPTPSAVIALRVGHAIEPSDLTAAGDSPIVPVSFHDAIVIMAVRNVYYNTDEDEKAERIERVELPSFFRRVRPPRAIEDYRSKPRGIRPRMGIKNRRIGL